MYFCFLMNGPFAIAKNVKNLGCIFNLIPCYSENSIYFSTDTCALGFRLSSLPYMQVLKLKAPNLVLYS